MTELGFDFYLHVGGAWLGVSCIFSAFVGLGWALGFRHCTALSAMLGSFLGGFFTLLPIVVAALGDPIVFAGCTAVTGALIFMLITYGTVLSDTKRFPWK